MARERFRLATFNVHHCRGRDGRVDIDRTAQVVQLLGADLIALQELDHNLSRSHHTDQPALLSEHTGYRVSFHPTLTIEQGRYGIALASREGLETTAEPLPHRAQEEPRIVVSARWRGVTVLTTHLSRDPRARAVQLEAVAGMAADAPPPAVVLGDLNEPRRALGAFRKLGYLPEGRDWSWIRTLRPPPPTGGIDHILVGREMTILRARRIPTDASDHRPLVVDVEIRRGK